MTVINSIQKKLYKETAILPLAIFRMAFGFLMAFSLVRFMYNGWVNDCYITPTYHFTYQYFNWVTPFNSTTMYAIVITCTIAALCIGLGLFYKIATPLFFFTFTYLELIEKSWYLNHYYFISLVAFLLILVPANANYAIDAKLNSTIRLNKVPYWSILIFKLQIATVYFFGGIAKLKSDWLLNAQPLDIWLKAKTDISYIGWLFEYSLTPYAFSWFGMLYDITIPFLLWTKKTRPIAYVLVVVFHILTYILFNIGMFPWIMIFGSLIFITDKEWKKIARFFKFSLPTLTQKRAYKTNIFILPFMVLYFGFQLVFPLRHHILTDNVLWSENGFRFSWNVMLMEKNGFAEFTIIDLDKGSKWKEYPIKRLTFIQEKQMSFQPDMIWQYAQYLEKIYRDKGIKNIAIYVNSKVSLNGRNSQTYINPNKNLLEIKTIDTIYSFVVPMR